MNEKAVPPVEPIPNFEQEYGLIIQKMGADEAWAYSFVALYFAFLASLSAATGFLIFSESGPSTKISLVNWMEGVTIVHLLAVLGVALNAWAIAMVFDYKLKARALIVRLVFLENELGLASKGPPGIGLSIAPKHNSPYWQVAQFVLVGSVMALFFLPWIAIISS